MIRIETTSDVARKLFDFLKSRLRFVEADDDGESQFALFRLGPLEAWYSWSRNTGRHYSVQFPLFYASYHDLQETGLIVIA